jgi:hypothetical protein
MIERWTGVKDYVVALRTPDVKVTHKNIEQVGEDLDSLIEDWMRLDPEFGEHCLMQREVLRARTRLDQIELSLARRENM